MRPTYSFSEAVVEAIARDRYHHPDPRVQERMEILWLKSKREPHGRIATLANVSRSTVQRTLRMSLAFHGPQWGRMCPPGSSAENKAYSSKRGTPASNSVVRGHAAVVSPNQWPEWNR